MMPHYASAARSITAIISTVHRATWNWIRPHAKLRAGLDSRPTIWTNCIAYVAMIKWVYRFVARAVVQLRSVLLLHWANTGMLSILYVPNVKSHFWDIVIMRSAAWPIVKRTTINCLAIFASFVIKSSAVMVNFLDLTINLICCFNEKNTHSLSLPLVQYLPPSTKLGVYITSPVQFAIRNWIKNRNSTNMMKSRYAKNAMNVSQMNCVVASEYHMKIQWKNHHRFTLAIQRSATPVTILNNDKSNKRI